MLAEKAHDPVRTMCDVLGVSRSGFYAWRGRPLIRPQVEANRGLRASIRAIHAASRGRDGSPRVHAALHADGHRVGRHRVMRLMRLDPSRGRPRHRFRVTTQGPWLPVHQRARYQDLRRRAGARCSMSRRWNCVDNAPTESFFRTLKVELADESPVAHPGVRAIAGYIERFYNRARVHSGLGYQSPARFEQQARIA